MKILKIIPYRQWFNTETGATASVYGALPYWGGEENKGAWVVRENGFTFENDNGTVGVGRPPMKSRELAERFMEDFNNCAWDNIREYV